MIVECKSKTRKDGITQLEDYLRLSRANIGIWFNGNEQATVRKYEHDGTLDFIEITDIPRYGERLEDIGLYKRGDLTTPHNLTSEFKTIRNYLAGNARDIVNDEKLAQELINIILCKLYDEKYTSEEETVKFRAGFEEPDEDVSFRINDIFQHTKNEYSDVFEESDKILLDPKSIAYVVGKLHKFSLIGSRRDVVADAFEVFIGPSLRGSQGQFFTPRNIVKTVIDIIKPKPDEYVIDPACGSGGFLSECLRSIHRQIDEQGKKFNWTNEAIKTQKITKITKHVRGIERDAFLSKVAKSYMIILGDGKSGIVTEDALNPPNVWKGDSQSKIRLGMFDVVITNPPFGSKIPVKGKEKLSQFELCYKWKNINGVWVKQKLQEQQSPQIAFIDRCMDLLKDGGRLGIVLPDGILGNPTYDYIRHSLSKRSEIIGIIDIPADAFRPSTNTKTHLLFLRKTKNPSDDYEFFMSYALTCGHDKRRRPIESDDVGSIPDFLKELKTKHVQPSNLGLYIKNTDIKNNVWLPKYYNLNMLDDLKKYEDNKNYDLVTIGDFIENNVLKLLNSGKTVNSNSYGDGSIPFIRTSDIANLEISEDPSHCVSHEEYDRVKKSQDVQPDDILFVKDGTFLIGKTAMITQADVEIVLQSHFIRLRILDKKQLSPYLLLGLLNTDVVRKQFDSKIFTQSSISTIGKRLDEIILPIPKSNKNKNKIIDAIKDIMTKKYDMKILSRRQYLLKKQNLLGHKNNGHQGNL